MNGWNGGRFHLQRLLLVTVEFRDGRQMTLPAYHFDWHHDPRDPANDIIRWDFA